MIVFKIIAISIAAGSGLLQIGLEYKWHDRRTKKHKRIRSLVIISMILSALTALFLVIYDDQRSEKQIQSLNDLKESAEKAATDAENREKKAIDDRERLRNEIGDKNNKIEELNKFILSSITGGDSFCYFSIGSISSDNSTGYLVLTHKGKYAIHGIQVRIDDRSNRGPIIPGTSIVDFMQTQPKLNIGTLYPGFNKLYNKVDLSGKEYIKWDIFFAASNGFSSQTLLLRFVEGRWLNATRVETYPDFKLIYEHVDPNFPRGKKGEIKWD